MSEGHAGYYGQEHLLILIRVRVSFVIVEPLLQGQRGLAGRVLAARLQRAAGTHAREPEAGEHERRGRGPAQRVHLVRVRVHLVVHLVELVELLLVVVWWC